MSDYQSFSTTAGKVLFVYNEMNNIKQNILNIPALQSSFRSGNQSSSSFAYKIVSDYNFSSGNLNASYLKFVFQGIDVNTANLISFMPIFRSSGTIDINYTILLESYIVWENQNGDMIANLNFSTLIRDQSFNNLPVFMNLYLVVVNDRLYYNV